MNKKLKHICIILICVLVSLNPIKVKAYGIILNNSTLTIGPNTSVIIGYTLSDELNSSNIVWTSSNDEIITVIDGVITAVSEEGSATITATINGNSSTCKVTISNDFIPVSSINLNKSSLNILEKTTDTLDANISPSNATNKNVIWHSSDPSIATIDSNGKITAKKLGTTIITATASNGNKTTCRVTVVDTMSLNEIKLEKETITIKEMETEQLNIIFNPSNATNKKVTWKSSNPRIVTVDAKGVITGIKTGTATITAVSNDGGYVAICKVTVEEISKDIINIILDKEKIDMLAGEKTTLNVTIEPDYADNQELIWSSSDENIAVVENGEITAISGGTASIKATSMDGNKEAICIVNVTSPPLKKISFVETEKNIYLGTKTTLNLIKEPATADINNLIWKSSNENILTVENGVINPLSLGETTITVSTKDKKISASIKINVIERPKAKVDITVEGYDLKFNPDTKVYNLTIKNEDKLNIEKNVEKEKVIINGNQKLKNGSIITITITDDEPITYIINIKKQNYTIYFIGIISVLLIINIIRIIVNKKKKRSK